MGEGGGRWQGLEHIQEEDFADRFSSFGVYTLCAERDTFEPYFIHTYCRVFSEERIFFRLSDLFHTYAVLEYSTHITNGSIFVSASEIHCVSWRDSAIPRHWDSICLCTVYLGYQRGALSNQDISRDESSSQSGWQWLRQTFCTNLLRCWKQIPAAEPAPETLQLLKAKRIKIKCKGLSSIISCHSSERRWKPYSSSQKNCEVSQIRIRLVVLAEVSSCCLLTGWKTKLDQNDGLNLHDKICWTTSIFFESPVFQWNLVGSSLPILYRHVSVRELLLWIEFSECLTLSMMICVIRYIFFKWWVGGCPFALRDILFVHVCTIRSSWIHDPVQDLPQDNAIKKGKKESI